MNLIDVKEEVIEGHLLPFLKWNDLLRFRRVCKTTRDITTTYLRVHPELAPELEINDQDESRSFREFLKMDIPTTKLFLNNEVSDFRFFEENQETATAFLKKYGHLVKSLRLEKMSFYFCDEEAKFVEGLTGLQSLEAAGFGNRLDDNESVDYDEFLQFPVTFKNGLVNFKVGQKGRATNVVLLAPTLVAFCEDLEFISAPFNSQMVPYKHPSQFNRMLASKEGALGFAFDLYRNIIRHHFQQRQGINLKTIDFANYHDEKEPLRTVLESRGAYPFHVLCLACLKMGIKFENVGANWFNYRENPEAPPESTSPDLGQVVVSLVNVQPGAVSLDMPNLKQVRIQLMSRCFLTQEQVKNPPNWPELKCLAICVDSKVTHQYSMRDGRISQIAQACTTKDLYSFFFKNAQRPQLVAFDLEFLDILDNVNPKSLLVPRTEEIVSSCANLKKLTLVNWQGTNKQLVTLWNGLQNLEEVSLERCKQLGNVAFVGEDTKNPVFLKLKNLKKLSLKGLDQMPKLTNTLFSLVLSHLSLSQLILTSGGPVQSVTLAGVGSLLAGKFAKSIEKFPFVGWSLAGVTTEEFRKLEQKFRSSKML